MYEFYQIYNSTQYDYMSETSFENKLKAEEIKYVELPKNIKRDKYISATPKKIIEEELEKEKQSKLKGQKIYIKNETTIESLLEETFEIKEDFEPTDLTLFLKNNVIQGDQYRFYEIDFENQTITYYQQFQEKMLYKNINGELILRFNDDFEVFEYKQTLLEDFEPLSEDENILQPIKGIETLYTNGELAFGSEITKVDLGYYTLVHLTSSQVLTPVWRFQVDNEEDLFVNAVDGQIIQLENEDKKIVE